MTYQILTVAGRQAIRCLLCGRISELPGDVTNRYCGRCHLFHDVIAEGRALLAHGGTHDCDKWATWRGHCALCGRLLNVPDCVCRTPGCGHLASQHTGPHGTCVICRAACWS